MLNGQKRVIEVDDEEAEKIIAATRHKELSGTLKTIAMSLSKEKDDKAVIEAIKAQGDKVASLVDAIKNLPQPEKPIVNVEVGQEKVISSVNQMCKDIIESNNKVIEALENRLLPDTFTLVKSYGGITESVKVNYKSANQIAIKK